MSRSFLAEVVDRVGRESVSPGYEAGVPDRPRRTPPSLKAAIERDREPGALLVEYKRASPGNREPLPPPRTVAEFVAATRDAPISGYSCLATAYGFDGAPARVAELAAATDRPVLFKEFVIDPRQVEVAARTGASAILLIARLARTRALRATLGELARAAHDRGLEVLLELHYPAELSQVDGVAPDVVGVNTRDLDTLRFERERAYRTLAGASDAGCSPLVGLSGVEGPTDARELFSRGCDGILVGTAVARAADPVRWLASLRGRPEGSA